MLQHYFASNSDCDVCLDYVNMDLCAKDSGDWSV